MFQIDIMSRIPVYEQLIRQTEKFILLGVLKEGDKLPSVRQLSAELSINPNTIQKAFTELDRRGIIFSVNGRGNFVADKALKALEVSRRSASVILRIRLRILRLPEYRALNCMNI